MRKRLSLAVACAFAVVALACGGSDATGTNVTVSLKEWSITPATAEVPAGSVTFELSNQGSQAHQLVVIKNDLPPNMLPVANGAIALTQVNVLQSIPPISPGATAELRFQATPGKYVLVCNVPGHYQQGMATSLLVEP